MSGRELGFGKLASIKPSSAPEQPIDDDVVDAIAERHGFKSREATEKFVRERRSEPVANLNIRPPIATYNRFVRWAAENNMSYPAALKLLMDRAGI